MKTSTHTACLSTSLPVLVALACFATAGAAVAAPDSEPASVTVRFDDLDLSKRAGAETLYRRIQNAASQVCGPRQIINLSQVQAWRECYQGAIADAVEALNESTVLAVHRGKEKRPPAG